MKNTGPYLAFDDYWFDKHQDSLIWLLNNRFTKRWARWVLRIHKVDCPITSLINRIEPNNFIYDAKFINKDTIEVKRDFRTHPKFAKRVYFAFRPIWWMMHMWDWLVSDRFDLVKQFSFGFNTLTAYPRQDGSTTDAAIARNPVNESFASIRGGAGVNVYDTTYNLAQLSASGTTNQYNTLMRYIASFNTSALTASANISAAVISFKGANDKGNGLGSPPLHVAAANPTNAASLAAGDYQHISTTSFGNIAYASYNIGSYNDITLNASGIAAVNKTGVTSFSTQLSWDILNNTTGLTWSSSAQAWYGAYFANETGTTQDPKLVVTYTIPSGPANVKTVNGLAIASVKTVDGLAIASVKTYDGLA